MVHVAQDYKGGNKMKEFTNSFYGRYSNIVACINIEGIDDKNIVNKVENFFNDTDINGVIEAIEAFEMLKNSYIVSKTLLEEIEEEIDEYYNYISDYLYSIEKSLLHDYGISLERTVPFSEHCESIFYKYIDVEL